MKKTVLTVFLLAAVAYGYQRHWLVESMEPLSALYGAFDLAVHPAAKADVAGVSMGFSCSSTGTNFDAGVRAAFNVGVVGLALYQTPGPGGILIDGSVWSLALPFERGLTLGYALRTEAGTTEHDLSMVLRPAWWMSLGLGVHRIGLGDPGFTAAVSFRPFGELWTVSYQLDGSPLLPPTHSFHSDLRLFKAFNLQVKYDLRELYTGFTLDLGNFTLSERAPVLASNRFTAWRHTVEWHAREQANQALPRPGGASAKGKRAQAWVPLMLRGAPQAILGRMDGLEYVPSLFELRLVVERILKNPSLHGLFLELQGFGGGYAVMEELRGEIKRLRAAGRKVVVFSDGLSQPEYYAACAADQVFLSKSGGVDLRGLRFEGWYFKEFLDLIGVSFDVVQAGNYKSYGEPFIRSNRSAYSREEEEHLLGVYAGKIFSEVRQARKLRQDVAELLAKGPYTAAEAYDAGLIDRVAYREEALEALQQEGVVFRPAASLFVDRERRWAGTFDPSIALIEITGNIIDGESFVNPFTGGGGTGSATVLRALDQAMGNPSTRAILVRVDSGGGSVTASDHIWNRLARIASDTRRVVPVLVSFGDVAASGGYYVSAGAGRLYASALTITGSIGVIFAKPNLEGLLARFKVRTDGSGIGPQAGSESLARPLSPEQRDKAVRDIMATYREFLEVVRKGRTGKGAFKAERLEDIAQGRVWTGSDACSNGLVDTLGGLGDSARQVESLSRVPATRLAWMHYNPALEAFPSLSSFLGTRLNVLGAGFRRLGSLLRGPTLYAPLPQVGLLPRSPFAFNPAALRVDRMLEKELGQRSGLLLRAPELQPVTSP